jgi:hypothetical protein
LHKTWTSYKQQDFFLILYYNSLGNAPNPSIKEIKGLMTYYKTYGIIILKKNVYANHATIAKTIEEEINNLMSRTMER